MACVSWRSVKTAKSAAHRPCEVSISRNSSAKSLPVRSHGRGLLVSLCLCAVPVATGCDSGATPAFSEPMTLGGREVSAQTLNEEMILGALIVGLAGNGLNLLGIPFFYQTLARGLLVIGAVLIDQKIRNRV